MAAKIAEQLLQELGVTEPGEIDLEAIAFYRRAKIRYRALEGCEARIIGCGDNAIITVRASSSSRRKRFSIAHELGHWHHHRGQCLTCRVEDYRPHDKLSPERVADSYAAELLMPRYLLDPLAQRYKKLTFKTVTELADKFHVSQTAMAIRLVESNHSPALLVCHGPKGRKWFTRASSVPAMWFPQDMLNAHSFAFGILFGSSADDPIPRKIRANAWFDQREAERYDVFEQTIRTGTKEVLSLVLISDAQMIEDKNDRRAKYWR